MDLYWVLWVKMFTFDQIDLEAWLNKEIIKYLFILANLKKSIYPINFLLHALASGSIRVKVDTVAQKVNALI